MIDPQRDWVRSEFERLTPVLQRAIDTTQGTCDIPDVWNDIDNGDAQLWPALNSIVITKIREYPTGLKAVLGWLAAGDMEEVKTLKRVITEWAKEQGCTRFYIIGRRGWLKSLEGFKEAQTMMYEEI